MLETMAKKKKKAQHNKQRQQRQQAKRQRNEKKRTARREAEKKSAVRREAEKRTVLREVRKRASSLSRVGYSDTLWPDFNNDPVLDEALARIDQSRFHKLREDVDVQAFIDEGYTVPEYFIIDRFVPDTHEVSGAVGAVYDDGRIALNFVDGELVPVAMTFEALLNFYEPLDVEELDSYEARFISDSV